MDLELNGRVALVAGGGRGVGAAVAAALAREGARVGVLARTAAEVEAVCAGVGASPTPADAGDDAGDRGRVRVGDRAGHGASAGDRADHEAGAVGPGPVRGRAIPLVADLTDADALGAALHHLRAEAGASPTLVVYAASAWFTHRKLHDVPATEAHAQLALDVEAAAALCARLLPDMMLARHGRIVFLGSAGARTGLPGASIYVAGKSALEGLARGLAVDYSRHGITANTVALGFVDTERLRARTAGDAAARRRLARRTAIGRLCSPAEVAEVVAFLCSARAACITGAVIDVDGGAGLGLAAAAGDADGA